MAEDVIIDGNNLLFAMREHAPLPAVGRETLVKVVERWARQGEDTVTLVFDGAVPPGDLARQMSSTRIRVRFSAPATADDIIVGMIHRARDPATVRVVTGDKAIRHEARIRRCRHTDAVTFVHELFPSPKASSGPKRPPAEKPEQVSPDEAREWLDLFDLDDEDPFDGHDLMQC